MQSIAGPVLASEVWNDKKTKQKKKQKTKKKNTKLFL